MNVNESSSYCLSLFSCLFFLSLYFLRTCCHLLHYLLFRTLHAVQYIPRGLERVSLFIQVIPTMISACSKQDAVRANINLTLYFPSTCPAAIMPLIFTFEFTFLLLLNQAKGKCSLRENFRVATTESVRRMKQQQISYWLVRGKLK